MRDEIIIEFIQHDRRHTEFDWANIIVHNEKVGQVRCHIEPNALTIFSIKVFPDFQGLGYASKFIEKVKKKYDIIIADRVRVTSSGFWSKMGFEQTDYGKWIYIK